MPNFTIKFNQAQSRAKGGYEKNRCLPIRTIKNTTKRMRTQSASLYPYPLIPQNSISPSSSEVLRLKGPFSLSLGLLLLFSQVRSSDSLMNGDLPAKPSLSKDLVPLIKMSFQNQTASTCTGLRLNKRQILTAKHCNEGKVLDSTTGKSFNLKLDACVEFEQKCIPVTKIVKHHQRDLAIMSTSEPTSKSRTCFNSYMRMKELKRNLISKNETKCSFKGDYLLAARGLKDTSEIGTFGNSDLTLGRFRDMKNNPYSDDFPEANAMSGLLNKENKTYISLPGDSGAPVFSCDHQSTLKLSGVLKAGDQESISLTTPVSHKSTLNWIKRNSHKCGSRKVNIKTSLLPEILDIDEDGS